MKFVYSGDYAVKDGVTFMFRNPSTVENKATIAKLLKDPLFRRCDEEKAEAPAKTEVLSDVCPKCGRLVKQGKVLHQRWCKGAK